MISSITIEGQANSQSQTLAYALIVHMVSDTVTCYFNASARTYRSIALAFASESEAKALRNLIQPQASNGVRAGRLSHSQGIVVSQDLSNDNLPAQKAHIDQDLAKSPPRAILISAQEPLPNSVWRKSEESGTSSQQLVTTTAPAQQGRKDTQGTQRVVSIAFGVDVTQRGLTGDLQTDVRTDANGECPKSSIRAYNCDPRQNSKDHMEHSMSKSSQRTSDTGNSKSMRNHSEFESMEHAPDFQEQTRASIDQRFINVRSPHQNEDNDDSCDAASKTYNGHSTKSETKMLPPPSLPAPSAEPSSRSEIGQGKKNPNEAIMLSKIPDTDFAIASPPKQVTAANRSVTKTKPLVKSLPPKISKRLRNSQGTVDWSPLVVGSKFPVEDGTEENSRANRICEGKGVASTKVKTKVQKHARPLKSATSRNNKLTSNTKSRTERVDVYQVQASPKPVHAVPDSGPAREIARALRKDKADLNSSATIPHEQDPEYPSKTRATKIKRGGMAKGEGPEGDDQPRKVSQCKSTRAASDHSNRVQQVTKQQQKPGPLRPRREAARKANEKIRGLETTDELDGIDYKDEGLSENTTSEVTHRCDRAIETSEGPDQQREKKTDPAQTSVVRSRVQKPSATGTSNLRVQIASSRMELEPSTESLLQAKSNGNNSDEVDLLVGAFGRPMSHSPEGTNPSELLVEADQGEMLSGDLTISKDEVIIKQPLLSKDADHDTDDQQEKATEQNIGSESAPKAANTLHETKDIINADPLAEDLHQPIQLRMMGDTEDSHFREAMGGDMEERTALPEAAQTSPTRAIVTVQSPQFCEGPSTRSKKHQKHATNKVGKSVQAMDPFRARLSSLLSPDEPMDDDTKHFEARDIGRLPKSHYDPDVKLPAETINQPDGAHAQANNMQNLDELSRQVADRSNHEEGRSRATRLPQTTPGDKRKLKRDGSKQTKKAKLTPRNQVRPISKESEGHESGDTTTRMPMVRKKPGLISWDTSGPRNQGATSTAKAETEQTNDVTARSGDPLAVESKTVLFIDDSAPREKGPRVERWGLSDVATPCRSRLHVPQMIAAPDSALVHERGHRLSSQSMKVDENGSPLPSALPRIRDDYHPTTPSGKLLVSNYHDIMVKGDDYGSFKPHLPTPKKIAKPKEVDFQPLNVTSNSKQLPSSPHAPSTFATMPPHVVLKSGEIVNGESLKSIVPTLPQDPFIGGAEKPPSSFIRMLRKSSAADGQHKSHTENYGQSSGGTKRKVYGVDVDPDETLVEPEPELEPKQKRQKLKHYLVPKSSFTSDSTSRGHSRTEVPSSDESDYEIRRWREALEPHQANMLDILTVITHVSILPA